MVRKSLLKNFKVTIVDKNYEGILWLNFQHRTLPFNFYACVCYLPPDQSTRNVDVDNFFDTLTQQIYCLQNKNADLFICGDFNARISDMDDHIPGVDILPDRLIVDDKSNKYGELFCDFLISVNCCVLNGRKCKNNDFTYVSECGKSVVDYCVVPYESLDNFSDIQVKRASELVDQAGCMTLVGKG